ncbi:MAG: sce7725 family protein, partial [Ruminococcus sp.]|nr:sce7725 family protein [Ruminococcus sp.]
SIVGKEYSESGFAPYAVAIHIVYLAEDKTLRIHHFVSDSNNDISDPANKFYEALTKLVAWNKEKKLNTFAMQKFEDMYKNETYPGLGVVKKLSIMHHIELIGNHLDEVRR